MYATVLNVTTPKHGGARAGAGRKSIFGTTALPKPFPMDFTLDGRRELDALAQRHGLSRNGVIGLLALQFADDVVFTEDAPYPTKARSVLSIRVPRDAGAKLAAARVRTGHGYSDIGEALVRQFGRRAKFPRRRRP